MIESTAHELVNLIKNQEISVSELVEGYLQQIETKNPSYQCLATYSATAASLLAQKADRILGSKEPVGRLHGIPVLVDDLMDVANMRTSYGSQYYQEHVPEVDSMAVRRLRQAGALIIGKTKTSEFGLIQKESANQYVAKSPWGNRHVSGGGSSGMSVSLTQNFAPVSIGIEIGANVLLPAAFNGTFAFRPTHGLIPHTPIYSNGVMFPDVTVVTKSVRDCALLMDLTSGFSHVDPMSLQTPGSNFEAALNRSIKPLKIAQYPSLWNAPIDDDHRMALAKVVKDFRSIGCQIERSRPPIRDSIEFWETIVAAELFTQQNSEFSRRSDQFSPLVAKWIQRGKTITAEEYIKAQQKIYGLRSLLRQFFDEFDVFIFAATGCTPFRYGEAPSNLNGIDEYSSWYQYASGCLFGAISGFPTAHLPCAENSYGLPIGVFVTAGHGNDDLIFSVCAAYEKILKNRRSN